MTVRELCCYRLFSTNAKSSISLDFPSAQAFTPTALWAAVCSARSPYDAVTWIQSLRKRRRNLRYFSLVSAEEAAERMIREFRREAQRGSRQHALDFLRINGCGDLFPAVIPVINLFAEKNPDVRVWVATRNLHLAAQIRPLENIYVQLSLDRSTPAVVLEAAKELARVHPRAYLSFLRSSASDDTQGAAIVFDEKGGRGLPYNGLTDCPVDAGKLPLGNVRHGGGTGCAICQLCFLERTVSRGKRTLAVRRKNSGGKR